MDADARLHFIKMKTATAVEHNRLPALFAVIPVFALAWTLMIFTVIFVTGESIEFDGVERFPGDPLYEQGFYTLAAWFAGAILLFGVVAVVFRLRSRPVLHWLSFDDAQNPVAYMKSSRREILATSDRVYDYDVRSGRVRESSDPDERAEVFGRAFFWLRQDPEGAVRTVRQNGPTIRIRIAEAKVVWSKRIVSYKVRLDPDGRIASAGETVEIRSGGNSRLIRWIRLVYADVDRHVILPVHPEIRSHLAGGGIIL